MAHMVVKLKAFSLLLILLIFLAACSSAPQRPSEVFTNRNTAANQLSLANYTASQGYFHDALTILEEARRLALITDDPALRINTAISKGNILFSLGQYEEAFNLWESAAREGEAFSQPLLASRARMYSIRAEIILLVNDPDPLASDTKATLLRTQITEELAILARDPISAAAGFVTLALAEKQLKAWQEAEAAALRALAIHEKNHLLEEAAYDWFIIASIRSVAENFDGALEALQTAIHFDRRAENAFGLASAWHATGDVYRKAARYEEALAAYQRAEDIYRAMGHTELADELRSFSRTLLPH